MSQRDALRASDADREHVAERLRHAAAEGRLLAEELEQRLGAAFKARTYGELDAVVSDLPVARTGSRSSSSLARPALALVFALVAVAVIAVVLLVIAGVLAAWGVWVLVAWWAFGSRRRHHPKAVHRGRSWHSNAVRGGPEPRAWL